MRASSAAFLIFATRIGRSEFSCRMKPPGCTSQSRQSPSASDSRPRERCALILQIGRYHIRINEEMADRIRPAIVDDEPAGGRHPRGGGTERRAGGPTAKQSVTPDRLAGRHVLIRPALCAGVEHGARLLLIRFDAEAAWQRLAIEIMGAQTPLFRFEA